MTHIADAYWQALERGDAEAMAACYAPDARFQDPVFRLQGDQIGKMWIGLFSGATDLEIHTGALQIDGELATGTWKASYTFSKTGRRVNNVIRTRITTRDGRIVDHVDRFGFWRWSRMALGPTGLWLGWTPLVRNKVRKMAARRLR